MNPGSLRAIPMLFQRDAREGRSDDDYVVMATFKACVSACPMNTAGISGRSRLARPLPFTFHVGTINRHQGGSP